jgi:nucleoside-diphosphate-sugar epimerase
MTSPSGSDGPDSLPHVVVTGGAGYIGSLLAGVLLHRGCRVTVVDDLLFGGESLLGCWHHPAFRFIKGDVCDFDVLRSAFRVERSSDVEHSFIPHSAFRIPRFRFPSLSVVHLAAIVGFPACQAVGRQVAWRYNVEAVQRVFETAEAAGAERFVFSSTYSNYGLAVDGGPVTEGSPLHPQSLYAETKIAAEEWLLEQASGQRPAASGQPSTMSHEPRAASPAAGRGRCAPLIFRFATLFGISPRTRFDLIVNQFVLEAMIRRELIIYQRGYSRSFVHVRDVVEGICLGLEAPVATIRGEVFNLGSDEGNYTKDEVVTLVKKHVDGLKVVHKDLSFGGDMRDITVSFRKIRETLGFVPRIPVEQGIMEVRDALRLGLIKDPAAERYRNAHFIVQ